MHVNFPEFPRYSWLSFLMGTKAMLEDVPAYSALDFHYKSFGQMRREPEICKASAILEVSGRLNFYR